MAASLRSKKAALFSEVKGASKKPRKVTPREGGEGFEPEDAHRSPSAKQKGSVESPSSLPVAPQGSRSKPDETFRLWETEYQEFLEDSAMEDHLLDQFSPWANSRAFLASFEQVAMASRWLRKEWVVRLLPTLNEDAEKAFVSLSAEDRKDYQKVKAAILRREAVARDKKREEFRGFSYQDAPGPREVHARLQELCHQWLNVERCSKQHILEMLVLEQFLKVLPQEMQNWVAERFPENCAQAVGWAEEFLKRLQGDEEEGEPEAEEVGSLSLRTKEIPLVAEKPPVQETGETEERPHFPRKVVRAGYRHGTANKKGYLQRTRYGDPRLRARFPGRVNSVLPYRRSQEGIALERRHSEPLQRGRPRGAFEALRSVPRLPPSPYLPEVASQLKRRSLQNAAFIKTCPECHLSFNGLASLRRHQMNHTGEKRYACSFCGKGFCFRSEVIRHECRHVGRKPHECSYCGAGFDRKWWRDQHQMEHTRSSAKL